MAPEEEGWLLLNSALQPNWYERIFGSGDSLTKLCMAALALLLASASSANATIIATLNSGDTLTGTFSSMPFVGPIFASGGGLNVGWEPGLDSDDQVTEKLYENVNSTSPVFVETVFGPRGSSFDVFEISGFGTTITERSRSRLSETPATR